MIVLFNDVHAGEKRNIVECYVRKIGIHPPSIHPSNHPYFKKKLTIFPTVSQRWFLHKTLVVCWHRISLAPTSFCRHVQLFSGFFLTCLTTWSQGKERKEKDLPEQWEWRLQAGKGVCGLGREEEAGRWPCSPQPAETWGAAACATSAHFSSSA